MSSASQLSPAVYGSPGSMSTSAIFAQHQARSAVKAAEPKHFRFSQSGGSFPSPTAESQRKIIPKDSRLKAPASPDETFDDPMSPGVCQDERDGLASLLTCSLISPKQGDERADVLSDDEDDLFIFSEDADEASEKKRPSSPIKEIATSLSCCSQDQGEEAPQENKALSPKSLVDDGTLEGTDGDTAGYTDEETVDKPFEKLKKRVTIQTEDVIHEYDAPTPLSEINGKHGSLLQQAKQRDPHADIHPYQPHMEIADDESEASMLVLMRYIGCTSQAYGETKAIPDRVLADSEEVLGSESDDDTTLSGWTAESSIRLNISACTYEEEGIEMTIDEFLPPSMRLVRSVSVDEGKVLSEAVLSVNGGSLVESMSFEESTMKSRPTDEHSLEDAVEKVSMEVNEDSHLVTEFVDRADEEFVSPRGDPVAAAMKAVQTVFTPRQEEPTSNKAERKFKPRSKTKEVKAISKVVPDEADKSAASSILPKKNSPVDNTSKASLPRGKPDITVKTSRSSISASEPESEPFDVSSTVSQTDGASPASAAKAFLASTVDASKSKPQEPEQVEPVTTDAKNYPAKTDDSKLVTPCTQTKAHLASPETELICATEDESTKAASKKRTSATKKAPNKHPVDDLIKAYLTQPKDAEIDLSAISPTTLQSPSVQILLKSNILSAQPLKSPPTTKSQHTPINQSTPKMSNSASSKVPQKKADPPQKTLEPSGASISTKISTTPSMSRLEGKLSKDKSQPIELDTSVNDIHVDRENSAMSPVSAISEGTIDTINTEALISMARRSSSETTKRTAALKKSSNDLLARANNVASDRSASSGDIHKIHNASISTIEEASNESEVTNILKAASKAAAKQTSIKVAKASEVNKFTAKKIELSKENQIQNKASAKTDPCNVQLEKHRQEINALRRKLKAAPSPEMPEESSSFDKNEVTKETKGKATIKTPSGKKEPTIAVVTPYENAREPPPPLTPCRKSVNEVDELLSKTRLWLAEHNKSRATDATPSLLARQVDFQRQITRQLASPSTAEKSIREELAALQARQVRNDRFRQPEAQSMMGM